MILSTSGPSQYSCFIGSEPGGATRSFAVNGVFSLDAGNLGGATTFVFAATLAGLLAGASIFGSARIFGSATITGRATTGGGAAGFFARGYSAICAVLISCKSPPPRRTTNC